MLDWWDEIRYLLNDVTIHYMGSRYEGRGTMTWKPDEGFHIVARLERHGPPLPPSREYGPCITGTEDLRTIRMTTDHGSRAIVPGLRMYRNYDVIEKGSLDVRSDYAIFCEDLPGRSWFRDLHATALLQTDRDYILMGVVERYLKVGAQTVQESTSSGGLYYADEQMSVMGWPVHESIFKLDCTLDPRYWSRAEAWRWPAAAELGFSILCGQTAHMVERRVSRGHRTFVERRKRKSITNLNFLSLFSEASRIENHSLIDLINFLAGASVQSTVCARIFWQLAEAARQQTGQGTELLCATILEAALRTLEDRPFTPEDRSWKIKQSMEQFRRAYLGAGWETACADVLQVFRSMRHRNAHPDWLSVGPGLLTKAGAEAVVDRLTTLARFYGYMILALSGERNLDPDFPEPRSQACSPAKKTGAQ